MVIELLVQDSITHKVHEISEISQDITWTTTMLPQPGKLTFNYLENEDVSISNGSIVKLTVNGTQVFFGYVFKVGKSSNDSIPIIAYDQTRYLKNKDTYVLSGLTASDIFKRICNDFNIKYEIITASTYIVPPKVQDNKQLNDIIQDALDLTLINEGNWYIVYDRFGTLCFDLISNLKTDLIISDDDNLYSYNYEASIDSDTYNQIKLVKDNKVTAKREVYIVKDSTSIKNWGILQYFDKLDETANAAQIESRADTLLGLKNRETKSLKLKCLGDLKVKGGSGVLLDIDKLNIGQTNLAYYMIVTAAHSFDSDSYEMQLEMQVSI
jgi:hypothetical protein